MSAFLRSVAFLGEQQIGDLPPDAQILQTRLGKRSNSQGKRPRGDVIGKRAAQLLKLVQNQPLQRVFQIFAQISSDVPQPLIALLQHLGDELARSLEIVIQMQKQIGQRLVAALQMAERVCAPPRDTSLPPSPKSPAWRRIAPARACGA